MVVEAGDEPPQQPCGGWTEDRQPELLDVGGAGIVATAVDEAPSNSRDIKRQIDTRKPKT